MKKIFNPAKYISSLALLSLAIFFTSTVVAQGQVPTVTSSWSPQTVTFGTPQTYSWSSTNATMCQSASGIVRPPFGAVLNTKLTVGPETSTITCTGPGGSASHSASRNVIAAPPPLPLPTVTSSWNPQTVTLGTPQTYSWSSTDATGCVSANGTVRPSSGSLSQTKLTVGPETSTITCTGPGGEASHSASRNVTAASNPAISTVPSTLNFGDVVMGQSKSLTFSVRNIGTGVATGRVASPGQFRCAGAACGGYSIPPGGSITVTLVFTPDRIDDFLQNPTVVCNECASNGSVQATGRGIVGSGVTRLVLVSSGGFWDFGATPRIWLARIRNGGDTDVDFSTMGDANFQCHSNCEGTLVAGEERVVYFQRTIFSCQLNPGVIVNGSAVITGSYLDVSPAYNNPIVINMMGLCGGSGSGSGSGAGGPVEPSVVNTTVSDITYTTAILGATVSSDGGSPITARGMCWDTTIDPTTNCLPEGGVAVGIPFTQARTGLPAGTPIYYRGYADNAIGRGYSIGSLFNTIPVGSVYITAPSCEIPDGSDTCDVTIGWDSSGPINPSIRQEGLEFSTSPDGSEIRTLDYGSNTFDFYDGISASIIATDMGEASCAPGSSWSGGICNGPPSLLPDLTAENSTPVDGTVFTTLESINFYGLVKNDTVVSVAEAGWAEIEIDWNRDGVDVNEDAFGGKIGGLSQGGTRPLAYTVAAGDAPIGDHRFQFHVDVLNEVIESNDGNNRSGWVNFSVAAPSAIMDLSAREPSIDIPSAIAVNGGIDGTYDNVQTRIMINNVGSIDVPAGQGISYKSIIDKGLPTEKISGIGADNNAIPASPPNNNSAPVPRPSVNGVMFGDHTVCSLVNLDPSPQMGEVNLNNNTSACPTFTLPVPVPSNMSISSNKQFIRSGETANISWTVHTSYVQGLACTVKGPGVDESFNSSDKYPVPGGAVEGNDDTDALKSTSEYVLTCTAPFGETFPDPVTGLSGGPITVQKKQVVEVIPNYEEQ